MRGFDLTFMFSTCAFLALAASMRNVFGPASFIISCPIDYRLHQLLSGLRAH